MRKPRFDYLLRQRQILLDMHVPDWDPGFLAKFDPVGMADLYQSAGADAVMHYCNSHVGLDNWPSSVGRPHRGLGGRDIVGETVSALHARGIASCAYYSSYFHNWAWTNHPDWRVRGVGGDGAGAKTKYGVCCPCNPDYHAFQLTQVEELASAYAFDGFFFDMVFWNQVCVCDSCAGRYRAEAGRDIPTTIDWAGPDWLRFVAARERWLGEAFADLAATVKRHADIPVFSNITPYDHGWGLGIGRETLASQDLLGGDFGVFGNDVYVASHLNAALTPSVLQYMNAFTGYVGGASYVIEDEAQFTHHALVSLLFGAQFLAIDAVEADGSVNASFYERSLASVFERMRPYGALLGGRPIGDVGVYFSEASRFSPDETGVDIARTRAWETPPHLRALRGAMRALHRARIAAAVLSRGDLADLSRYRVIVLPNVISLSGQEADALRDYVGRGGKLYASAHTSRFDPEAGERGDFALGKLFGCAFEAVDRPMVAYLRPQTEALSDAIAPRRVAAHGSPRLAPAAVTVVRVRAAPEAEVLATLVMPFGGHEGTRENEDWSSIHALPPYVATEQPMIVRRGHGAGEVIYSAADIEADNPPVVAAEGAVDAGPSRLFAAIIRDMLGRAVPAYRVDADDGVFAVAFDDEGCRRLHIANIPPCAPFRSAPRVTVAVAPPPGRRAVGLSLLPGGEPLAHRIDPDGVAHAVIVDLQDFVVVALYHLDANPGHGDLGDRQANAHD